jgi:hypothetical protein
LAVRQGVFWGVGMAFILGASKEDIWLPAALFGVGMGAFTAPSFMTVKVSTAIDSHERAAVQERIRHLLVSRGYRLQETGDGYARFEPTSGFKDFSIGPMHLVPDASIVMSCDSDTLMLGGPFSGVKQLAEWFNGPVASATSLPTTTVRPVEHSAPEKGTPR